jgi:hypothetical protein
MERELVDFRFVGAFGLKVDGSSLIGGEGLSNGLQRC